MKKYLKYAKPYLIYFIFGPLFMLTEVVGDVIMPKMMSLIIKHGVYGVSLCYIIKTGIIMIFAALLMMAGGVLGSFFAAKASVGFASDLRLDVFKKVQNFAFEDLDRFSTGSLVTRLTNDITQMQNVLRMALIMLLRSPGMLVGAFIMAFSINSRLAAIIALVIPILGGGIFLVMKTAMPRFDNMQKKLDTLNSKIQENFTNIRVVKSFVRSGFENKKFSFANNDLKESTLNAMNVVILSMPLMTLMMNITTIAVVWFGGNLVIVGGLDVGDLAAFTTYIVQILTSLMMLSMIILQGSRALASARRVSEVLNTTPALNDENAALSQKKVESGLVEFDNVSFGYGKNLVLENISFTALPGQTVGILGATGSGKTSLVSLIPRLYDVSGGAVKVDGANVKDYSLENLRNAVAMVLQKNVLFSGSIRENLLWGDENATGEQISAFCDMAQASAFVETTEDGYDRELGQGGVNVSGGQKQRLCIARALLKNPKILILDDSTSAVDTATESKIRSALKTELKDTTKIIIAQRISSVTDADEIIVIDDGKIVAKGTHDYLLKNSEHYQDIYYSQKEKEEA